MTNPRRERIFVYGSEQSAASWDFVGTDVLGVNSVYAIGRFYVGDWEVRMTNRERM